MEKEKFGLFAINLNCKVTQEVKIFDKMRKLSSSIGFKQKDGTWVNEWLDLVIFDKDIDLEGIKKGDRLKVTGRFSLSEWTNKTGEKKKQWSCFCDEVRLAEEEPPF